MSSVSSEQRFRKSSPCPICGGYDEAPRGKGQRCSGFLSSDGKWAHCSREEYAGGLALEKNGTTYAHRLSSSGVSSHVDAAAGAPVDARARERIVETYDYVNENGELLYQVVRFEPKTFKQRKPGTRKKWDWKTAGVRRVIYHLPAVREAINRAEVICIAEGERDVHCLEHYHYTATCNDGGAGKWTEDHSRQLIGASRVVIFGDHDRVGRQHVSDVCASLRRAGITPHIANLDGIPEKGDIQDWMDRHTQEDLDHLIADTLAQHDTPQPTIDAPESIPLVFSILRGGRPLACQLNAETWLDARGIAAKLYIDTFRQRLMCGTDEQSDEMLVRLLSEIEADTGMSWPEHHVRQAMLHRASQHARSPLKDWLDGLGWDGKARVDDFFLEVCGADASAYSRACARVLFLSAVARAYQPGCQADVMVVMIGEQGIGKSKTLLSLVPEESWYTDDLGGDLQDRRASEGLQGKWLVEFGEFARINRSTVEMVKSYISRRADRYRAAYARTTKDYPRQCVFIGTTNNHHPLQDRENRRFMPIHCRHLFLEITPREREQLWAEAVMRYKKGEPWWITDHALITETKDRQEEARQVDAWEDMLTLILAGKSETTMEEIAEKLGIKSDRLDKPTQVRLGIVMQVIGFTRKRIREGLGRRYVYVRNS